MRNRSIEHLRRFPEVTGLPRPPKAPEPEEEDLRYCAHDGEDSWWEYDAQGIELCSVCDKCRKAKLAKYRPEILSGYDQGDVAEPIEPEDY